MELEVDNIFCLKVFQPGKKMKKKKTNNVFFVVCMKQCKKTDINETFQQYAEIKSPKLVYFQTVSELSFWSKTIFIENRGTLFLRFLDGIDVQSSILST